MSISERESRFRKRGDDGLNTERESRDGKRGDDGLKTNHIFVLNTDMAAYTACISFGTRCRFVKVYLAYCLYTVSHEMQACQFLPGQLCTYIVWYEI